MIFNKIKAIQYIIFITLLFSIIEINAPIIAYGTQVFGYLFLITIAYILNPYLSLKIVLTSLLLNIFIIILSAWQFTYLEYKDIFWLNTFRTLFWINCAIFSYGCFNNIVHHLALKKIVRFIVILSSFIVYIQFLSYYLLGIEIDLSILLGGEGVRSVYNGLEGINYRPTGLTSEPAIHTGIMIGLLTLYYILDNNNKFITLIGISSIILTFSTLGILLALLFIIVIYTRKISTVIFAAFILLGLFPFIVDSLVSRYDLFVSGNDGSNNVKFEVIESLFSNPNYLLTGMGFVGKDNHAPDFYEALYDLTYFITLHVYFGFLLGTVLLCFSFYLLYKSKFLFREKLLILLALLKLSGPTFMFFSFFIMFTFIINKLKIIED